MRDAPLLTPKRYGSASGFRRTAWYATPAAARAAPMRAAFNADSVRNCRMPICGQPNPVDPKAMQRAITPATLMAQRSSVRINLGALQRFIYLRGSGDGSVVA